MIAVPLEDWQNNSAQITPAGFHFLHRVLHFMYSCRNIIIFATVSIPEIADVAEAGLGLMLLPLSPECWDWQACATKSSFLLCGSNTGTVHFACWHASPAYLAIFLWTLFNILRPVWGNSKFTWHFWSDDYFLGVPGGHMPVEGHNGCCAHVWSPESNFRASHGTWNLPASKPLGSSCLCLIHAGFKHKHLSFSGTWTQILLLA